MYDTIYIEQGARSHPRTQEIADRFPDARKIVCDSYSEVFNRKAQDFRLQKQNPSLVLATKEHNHVLSTPSGYGVGGDYNYYFSTMLNCIYDCRYCFLQGMYSSAHHVVFVNYEDFSDAISNTLAKHKDSEEIWFFSGYDCDSLALEPVIALADYFVSEFKQFNAILELRTKSTQIRSLTSRPPMSNVVAAFSVTPHDISKRLEHKVPSLNKRIEAMKNLQEGGWLVGLRFDPMIHSRNFKDAYRQLFDSIFENVSVSSLHSISVGGFRLPRDFHKQMVALYPDDKFLALPFESVNGIVSYPSHMEDEMIGWCVETLGQYADSNKIFVATLE